MSDCSANAWHVLPDREPGVLYIHGVSIPGLDYSDYKAIEVDGHRFERVRECELKPVPFMGFECSECGKASYMFGENGIEMPKICPNCCARVKGAMRDV